MPRTTLRTIALGVLWPLAACESRGPGTLTRALELRSGQLFHALPPEASGRAPRAAGPAPRRRDARVNVSPALSAASAVEYPAPRLLPLAPIVLTAGDSARPAVELASGNAVVVREAAWRSLDPSVVRAEGGAFVALRAGSATVVASVDGVNLPVEVEVRRTLRGRVLDAYGAPVAGGRVLVSGGRDAQLVTGPDGRFALAGTLESDAPLSLRVSPVDASLHAATVTTDGDDAGAVGVVLVPVRWQVRGGARDGVVVPLRGAVARVSATFARVQAAHGDAGDRVVGWPGERYPLSVAFAAGIGAAEVASFWAAARALERDLGRALFTPVPSGAAGAAITVRVSSGLHTSALTHTAWTGRGDVFDAELLVRDAGVLRDRGIVGHELLHALGFSHGTAWPSLAAPTGASSPGWLTDADVAWAQLLLGLREVQERERAQHGLAAAVP